MAPPPITGKIFFRGLRHNDGGGTLSNRIEAVIDALTNGKAFLIFISGHELHEPIELHSTGVGVPGTYIWETKNSVSIFVGENAVLDKAKLLMENRTDMVSDPLDPDDNRTNGDWVSSAWLTFGDNGQQKFEDLPINIARSKEISHR
ncbi:hypothetical protein TWF730_009892 [Orbilia blumenaviensis]|uniref:Uncharacterized protein n=1 Tax=Orbilia blumenaviensis TaxID=1796055 RepID=A0AAV9UW68_9PEZI